MIRIYYPVICLVRIHVIEVPYSSRHTKQQYAQHIVMLGYLNLYDLTRVNRRGMSSIAKLDIKCNPLPIYRAGT